jgi:hypothetical protein
LRDLDIDGTKKIISSQLTPKATLEKAVRLDGKSGANNDRRNMVIVN